MRAFILAVLIPTVLGYFIPNLNVAYHLFSLPIVNPAMNEAIATQIGKCKQVDVNPLTKAFEDAEAKSAQNSAEDDTVQAAWEAFSVGEWARSSLGDDNERFGEMIKGNGDGDHHGHHGGGDHHHHRGYDHGGHHHPTLHDIFRHHGFFNDHDKYPHHQPHGDHGHDGLSGHHSYHDIPKPHRDGHYHSNSTLWDLVDSCPQTSIFASFAKRDTMFHNLLKDPQQNVTLFVPSNDAFKRLFKYGIIPKHGIDKDLLSKILNYHTVVGTHVSDDLIHRNTIISRLQDDKLGRGMHQRLRVGLDQVHGPSVNFFADILLTDVLAKNGVVHGIGAVLLPPPSIEDILELLPTEFSTTTGALYRTGLIDDLPKLFGKGLTVFAPSNADWEKLGWRASAFLFSDKGKEYLKAIMKYHIVPSKSLYSDALVRPDHHNYCQGFKTCDTKNTLDDASSLRPGYTHLQLPTLLKDEELSVDITRYERFLSFRVNGYNDIIISDGIAKDGVVQVPNHVIIPPYSQHHGSDWKEEEELVHVQEKVREAQQKGGEIEVEDLKKILKGYVDKEEMEQEDLLEDEL